MYDFYFDTKKEIQKNPENFLLFVKKLLDTNYNVKNHKKNTTFLRLL